MAKLETWAGVKEHAVVTPAQWLAARKALLAKEKKFTKLRDRLNQERRNLPWVKVEKDYHWSSPKLSVLGRSLG
jgi:predicted dithiol-disulfide oxidoreductase (DUF899 family)